MRIRGVRRKIYLLTYDKKYLNQRALRIRRSFDEGAENTGADLNAHLAESICKTHSKTENMEPDELIIQPHIFDCIVDCFFRNVLFIKPKLQVEVKQII